MDGGRKDRQKVSHHGEPYTDRPVTLHKGTQIATLDMVEAPTGRGPEQGSVGKEMLEQMMRLSERDLTETRREKLLNLLKRYSDIFAENRQDVGRTDKVTHRISTETSPSIRQPVRCVPPTKREDTRKLLQGMLDQDVIRPSSSPWASPIVLVKKKDGSTRFCVYYRKVNKVNKVTRKDAYPLPRVDDTLDTLAGAKWFSTLDLISAGFCLVGGGGGGGGGGRGSFPPKDFVNDFFLNFPNALTLFL